MGRLEHNHIVPVHSCGKDGDWAFIVMKLVDGKNLRDLAATEDDSKVDHQYRSMVGDWCAIARLAANVASGLQHLHDNGIVHRDVKPSNLILDAQGKVWITDFGLAKLTELADQLTATGDAIGTPRYMAPEQLRGLYDARSDVYSLGITLYELAAGPWAWKSAPVDDDGADEFMPTLRPIKEGCVGVPADLTKIIGKACHFDPKQRYQTAEELQVVLERFANGTRPSDRRRNARSSSSSAAFHKKRRVKPIAVGVVTSLLIGFGLLGVKWNSPKPTISEAPEFVTMTSPEETAVKHLDFTKNMMTVLADDGVEDLLTQIEKDLQENYANTPLEPNAKSNNRTHTAAVTQISELFTMAREEGLVDSIDEVLEGYRSTTHPVRLRIADARDQMLESKFPHAMKKRAADALTLYSSAIARGIVASAEADDVVDQFERLASLQSPRDSDLKSLLDSVADLLERTEKTNLVINGSFEANETKHDIDRVEAVRLIGWSTLDDEPVEVWRNGNQGCLSSSGDKHIELDNGTKLDGIYQDVITEEGKTYLFSMDIFARNAELFSDDEAVVVEWNGEPIKKEGFKPAQPGRWRTITFPLTGNGKPCRLLVRESRAVGANDGTGPFLDNIQLLPKDSTADYAPCVSDESLSPRCNQTSAGSVAENDVDLDGNRLRYRLVTQPTNGSVQFEPTGNFRYTPNKDFVGRDFFLYKASDLNGNQTLGRVNLRIEDLSPVTTLPKQ